MSIGSFSSEEGGNGHTVPYRNSSVKVNAKVVKEWTGSTGFVYCAVIGLTSACPALPNLPFWESRKSGFPLGFRVLLIGRSTFPRKVGKKICRITVPCDVL